MPKQTNIFMTANDLKTGIRRFEAKILAKYVLCEYRNSPEITVLMSLLEDNTLGISATSKITGNKRYLVANRDDEIKLRPVIRQDGITKWVICDSRLNPDSIIFSPGGIFMGQNIIAGHINTASNSNKSIELYNLFVRELTRGCISVKGYKIGCEAMRLKKDHFRFVTIGLDSPSEYDLIFDTPLNS